KSVEVIPYKADFSKENEIKRIYYYINNRFKRLDLLVNNAAIFRKVDFYEINNSLLDEFINTNLKSVIISTVEAAKIMKDNKDKPCKIINIASLGGIQNWSGYIPYSISKAGVIKFTYLSAKRLAPDILINCISPGTINIDKSDSTRDNVDNYPMKRFCDIDDIKNLIKFLIMNNNYITGNNFI
ncbi:MAG: SDR family oxidoreductase, partial [Spirochaetes bacterium]|nr:SDR family oxidoreductase [Spirochaetota bacterium]